MVFNSSPKIVIGKDKGLYGFSDEGATGKSYLYSSLLDLQRSGYTNILALSYYDEGILDKLRNFDKGVIILDRLDLYLSDDIQKILDSKREDCLILFDLKNWNRLIIEENGVANISLSVDSLEVDLYEVGFWR